MQYQALVRGGKTTPLNLGASGENQAKGLEAHNMGEENMRLAV